ncbi:MAG: cell wall-binding repeat-containing protein [Dethiobacter sp.]|jgi:putative cell wall-binding protein|nr:cell wall-binding repeat-containing protein [Dethiobacter sp.]
MTRKYLQVIVFFLCLFLLSGVVLSAGEDITRISGANRYETSVKVAKEKYTQAETVIIARGDEAGGYADGLAASMLAGVLDAPILLTSPTALPASVAQALTDFGTKKVFVLGGEMAVSAAVENSLKARGLQVERITGASRFETAVNIATRAKSLGAIADYAFIVSGFAPADSLVAGSAAFKGKVPILLVSQAGIPEVTRNALSSLGIKKVYIVGGTGVVSAAVAGELGTMVTVESRLAGTDRYATSVAFARALFLGQSDVGLVRGANANLADAIGASVFGRPMLYVTATDIPAVVSSYLEEILTAESRVAVVGGESAVGNIVIETARNKILESNGAPTTPSTPPSVPSTPPGTAAGTITVSVGVSEVPGFDFKIYTITVHAMDVENGHQWTLLDPERAKQNVGDIFARASSENKINLYVFDALGDVVKTFEIESRNYDNEELE